MKHLLIKVAFTTFLINTMLFGVDYDSEKANKYYQLANIHYSNGNDVFALIALEESCKYGHPTACKDHKNLSMIMYQESVQAQSEQMMQNSTWYDPLGTMGGGGFGGF